MWKPALLIMAALVVLFLASNFALVVLGVF
jgi:hypothetical protein